MRNRIISRTVRMAVVVLLPGLIAIGTSCTQETASTSAEPLSSCVVFADYDVSDPAAQTEFEAAYADYAHLLNGTVSQEDILRSRQQRLDSLDQLKQHYLRTSVRELPDLVKDAFAPDWNTWAEWQVFSEKFHQGDELWDFACPPSQTERHSPGRGYVIVRDGRLHAMLLNRTVTFHASCADYESLLCGVATEDQIMAWKQQPLNSLEELRQHYYAHFGRDSSRILLEERCRLDDGAPTKWNHWHVFGRKYEAGEQLWYFESPAETWNGPSGRCGYLITRDGRLQAILVVAIS
jgi:hypothetical protein